MFHSTWPRVRRAAACCCTRGQRLYSSRDANRTLPDRPGYDSAPRGRTRTFDRRDQLRSRPTPPNRAVQQKLQAERNLRRRLVEGRLSLAEQTEAAAAIEGLSPEQITSGVLGDLKRTDPEPTSYRDAEDFANPDQESGDNQWSLLKRRQRNAETELAPFETTPPLEESEARNTNTEAWPLLKRREPSYGYMMPSDMSSEDEDSTELVTTPPADSTDLVAATRAALARKDDFPVAKSHTMIRIDGLSTNVHASDFYRIAETDLSKWNQSIKKVQQVRDRMTLEPTGTYNVTFSTAVAATAYAARFQRLHAMARVRARSSTGLWRSEVPPALLQADDGATQDDLEAALARLTRLTDQVVAAFDARLGHDDDDGDAANGDGEQRQAVAAVSEEDEKHLRAVLRKREGLRRVARHMEGAALRRFVVAFRDDAEAQRFHRLWNGRWLGGRDMPPAGGAPRHFVRTQVLDY
ncbi:hypothetical protein CCM_07177 [Cordyceps militaris CM01]|uniref:Uncharacterized protein n=1 Tax=Cordyceps militaris (strain CM01) TaxID=983644 RepID=G3JM33_CORMM|nr:uncharacterized protein CCM_07177 [Cordyceps militaris CM01]EGX90757.1 hypothetical protein CCM_07177 [Cordyceps militaris CM01]